jgi:hypothetical protein
MTLAEAEATDSTAEVLTAAEITQLLGLRPCHLSGTHDPTHTPRFICDLQKVAALDRLMEVLGLTYERLPRGLHDHGHWCCHPKDSVTPDPTLAGWVKRGPEHRG